MPDEIQFEIPPASCVTLFQEKKWRTDSVGCATGRTGGRRGKGRIDSLVLSFFHVSASGEFTIAAYSVSVQNCSVVKLSTEMCQRLSEAV
jgi:hypothetical protein